MIAAHQRDCDTDETGTLDGVQHQTLGFAHHVVDRHHARQRARDQHRHHRDPYRRDTRVEGSLLGPAESADLVAEAGAPDQHPDGEAGEQTDEQGDIGRCVPAPFDAKMRCDVGQLRQMRHFGEAGGGRVHAAHRPQPVDQHVVQQGGSDEVEHDRGDDDVAAAPGLEPCRDQRPEGAESRRAKHCGGQCKRPVRPGHGQKDKRDAKATHRRLTLAADVEQPGVIGDRDREAGEDEVGGVVEGIAPAIGRPECARDHHLQRHPRALTDQQDHRPRDRECKHQRDQRRQNEIRPARHPLHYCSAPAIIRPSSVAVVSAGLRSPMMRPSNMTATRSERAMISSSSTLTSRIAVPASRRATNWR